MKFFEHLLSELDYYSVYNTSTHNSTKINTNSEFLQNNLKHPDKSVAIIQPQNFDDILRFVKFISGNRSAVIDFNYLCSDQIVRCVDFVSGAVCALDGKIQNISKGIYLFAPNCTKLMTNKRKKQKR